MAKPTKKELVMSFVDLLNPRQQEILQELLNRVPTRNSLITLFTKAFKRTISVASRKGKSRGCQQEVCQMISDFTGVPWGKDLEIASREMGQSGTDVRLSEAVLRMFPYSVECKDSGQWSVKDAINQAQGNLIPGTNWVVFHRQTGRNEEDRMDMVAIIDVKHFFTLLEENKILKTRQKLLRRPKKDSLPLSTPVIYLNLSVRAINALTYQGIGNLDDLISCTEERLYKMRNMGRKTVKEIRFFLAEQGLSLKK